MIVAAVTPAIVIAAVAVVVPLGRGLLGRLLWHGLLLATASA